MTKSIISCAQNKPDHFVVMKMDCSCTVPEIQDQAFSIMRPLKLVCDETEFSQTDLVTLTIKMVVKEQILNGKKIMLLKYLMTDIKYIK